MKCFGSSRLHHIYKKQAESMTRTKELCGVGFMIRALIHCAEASVLWEQIGRSCEERLGTCWEKLWTKLGKGWEKGRERSSGTKLRKGWAQVGNRLGTSWERVGKSWETVANKLFHNAGKTFQKCLEDQLL